MKALILIVIGLLVVGCGKKDPVQPLANKPIASKPEEVQRYTEADEKGFAETKSKAEAGNALAQYNIGVMYYEGQVVEQDFKEAIKWYRRAAEGNHSHAQCNLGVMYANGVGVKRDSTEAVKWYRMSVKQNNAAAQFNLGVMYVNGAGVEKDLKEGIKWISKAAEQNHKSAKAALQKLSSSFPD